MNKQQLEKIKSKLDFNYKIQPINQYFKASVLLLLTSINDEYHIVFEKRANHIKQPGEICFPGGAIEANESPLLTALRETEEELKISSEKISIIGRLDSQLLATGSIIHGFIGIVDFIDLDSFDSNEVEKVFTVPLSFFIDNPPNKYQTLIQSHTTTNGIDTKIKLNSLPVEELGLPSYYKKSWGNIIHDIYVYPYKPEIIWGLTAKFIYQFIEEIENLL